MPPPVTIRVPSGLTATQLARSGSPRMTRSSLPVVASQIRNGIPLSASGGRGPESQAPAIHLPSGLNATPRMSESDQARSPADCLLPEGSRLQSSLPLSRSQREIPPHGLDAATHLLSGLNDRPVT